MTDKPTPTDAELKALWQLHAADIGGIFDFARAVLEKWGTPAGAGEPFGYFHQLLNHEGKGNGVWLGAAERKVVEQAHTPGETSEEIVALYTTPQPTQAQAAVASPLTKLQRKAIAVCFTSDKVSVSEVQRQLSISYADAQTLCQSMLEADLAKLTERGAVAWKGIDPQDLRDGGKQ